MPSQEPFVVPEPSATVEVPLAGGGAIVLRRHGEPRDNRILLSHGNGLAADLYYPLWSRFLPDFEVVLFDCRNHGWNLVGDLAHHNPRVFALDIDEVIAPAVDRHFGEKPTVGLFHSLSALVCLILPSKGAWFSGLILFDPPVCRPGASQLQFDAHAEQTAHQMRIRAEVFPTREAYTSLLGISPALRQVDPRLLPLMAETTLRPRTHVGFGLRCPAAYEAQALKFMSAYAALADIEGMKCPVKVIGSDPTVPSSYLPSFDINLVTAVDYDFIPEVGHLAPLEAPEKCHALTMDFLRRQRLVGGGAPAPDQT